MRLKRADPRTRMCALVCTVLLFATALTAAPALALPEGRVYEMVSPVYKGGYPAGIPEAVAPDGESVAFNSLGLFAGLLWNPGAGANSYLARRGASGWSTSPLGPPPVGGLVDFSANLEYALGDAPSEATKKGQLYSTGKLVLLHRTDMPDIAANWEVAGGIVLKGGDQEGASGDLCHIVIARADGPLLPEAAETEHQIYDLARGCGGEPSLRLVAVKNTFGVNGEPAVINAKCPVESGIANVYAGSEQSADFNMVSGDGREIFFTTSVEPGTSTNHCGQSVHQLFVRLDGSRTLEVSKSMVEGEGCGEVVPCPGAVGRASAFFKGASEDGSRVFFTTTASLVSGDEDSQNDLYMARIGCPSGEPGCEVARKQVTSLVQVSHDPVLGQAAGVQGVVRVARDGSRVYFVAHGVLTQGANVEGKTPVMGADNLYVYDTGTGGLAFVVDLCSGPRESGEGVEDIRCPPDLIRGEGERNDTSLWGFGLKAQSTADGRFLVFASFGRLLKGDVDNRGDVYRYDAVTGMLDRVSLGEGGYDANGNDSAFDAVLGGSHSGGISPGSLVKDQYEMFTRAISEDGSRVLFEAAGPLSPDAVNGLVNVYEWHKEPGWSEGEVSLVSSGSSLTSDGEAVMSPSGRDIFFNTSQGLVSQDTDGLPDIYDARLEGGFSPVPGERQPCSGDACQGPLTNPAPLLVPGSVPQAPGGNFAEPVVKHVVKVKKVRSKRKRRKRGKSSRRSGKPGRAAAGRSGR
jgi:hypothetical protein